MRLGVRAGSACAGCLAEAAPLALLSMKDLFVQFRLQPECTCGSRRSSTALMIAMLLATSTPAWCLSSAASFIAAAWHDMRRAFERTSSPRANLRCSTRAPRLLSCDEESCDKEGMEGRQWGR